MILVFAVLAGFGVGGVLGWFLAIRELSHQVSEVSGRQAEVFGTQLARQQSGFVGQLRLIEGAMARAVSVVTSLNAQPHVTQVHMPTEEAFSDLTVDLEKVPGWLEDESPEPWEPDGD